MEENSNSVYFLITKLCEKFSSGSLKKSRAKCYEILLSKIEVDKPKSILEGVEDPICHLLAWKYDLITVYGRPQLAEKIQTCIDTLERCRNFDSQIVKGMLQLLLQFRKVPPGDYSITEKFMMTAVSFPNISLNLNEDKFRLPYPILCSDTKLCDSSFLLRPNDKKTRKKFSEVYESENSWHLLYRTEMCDCCNSASKVSCRSIEIDEEINDEGYISPTKNLEKDELFWEKVLEMKVSSHRTWESFGSSFPEKELPFLTELGNHSDTWVLQPLNLDLLGSHVLVTHEQFIKDIKYVLVGIASKTFQEDKNGVLSLTPGVYLNEVAPDALKNYTKDLISCGNCYRALNNLVAVDQLTGQCKYKGYIFSELCESVKRYLNFYQVAALSFPDNARLLTINAHIKKLHQYMATLTSVCKVGPFVKAEEIPIGGALLNYLCTSAMNCTNKDTLMVLCSVLFPCCQVYFNRFLQHWILEGVLRDPYNEFFIKSNNKYLSVRGRNYWTRSYAVDDHLVPEFLKDFKQNILACGKSMQLLKLCVPSSPLCSAATGFFMSCCLTAEQLKLVEQNCSVYYLQATVDCSPVFSLRDKMRRAREENADFFELIAKKKAVTLKRLELERQKDREEMAARKLDEMDYLKEQYDSALASKHLYIAREMKEKMGAAEKELEFEKMREKLIQEEAESLVKYYEKLGEASEHKLQKINEHIKHLEGIELDLSNASDTVVEELENASTTSTESFQTTKGSPVLDNDEEIEDISVENSISLDVINGNDEIPTAVDEIPEVNKNYLAAQENFKAARRNRAKVLNLELGVDLKSSDLRKPRTITRETVGLTEAQRNKLRVMSSEFGIDVRKGDFKGAKTVKSAMELNKIKNMSSNECFFEKALDNVNFVNQNFEQSSGDSINANDLNQKNSYTNLKNSEGDMKIPDSLSLELATKIELEKPTPMSIDSTPISELPSTPSTANFWHLNVESAHEPQSATNFTEDGFPFPNAPSFPLPSRAGFSKRVSIKDAEKISTNCLKLFMEQSVAMPMVAQMKLTNNELLKYFVEDLRYLKHLESLRNYFFLQDGEFCRNLTESLFEKLYEVNFPSDLVNFRTLQFLVNEAVSCSNRTPENGDRLSFKINNLPDRFDLRDLNVLDCLSLSYIVEWPLNLLLPPDTLSKYDEVFKYLLKLQRVSWVQKKIFQELKILAMQVGKNKTYLATSHQYRRVHQCRHLMTHFIQTFQNYIIGEVLHTNWESFEDALMGVTDLDQLYSAHVDYVKNIIFMCLLRQEAAPIQRIFEKIFIVMLKFYDYLRSRTWTVENGTYVHPNFSKLENIFSNFEDFVVYLFKVGQKIVKIGYQPHLVQLLDMLDLNGYYSGKVVAH